MPPLGHQRDAATNDRLGHEAGEGRAVERDRAALGLQRAGERAEQGRLAGAVGPERRDDLTRRDLSETSRIATTAP